MEPKDDELSGIRDGKFAERIPVGNRAPQLIFRDGKKRDNTFLARLFREKRKKLNVGCAELEASLAEFYVDFHDFA